MTVLITGASGFIGSRLIDAACGAYGSENVLAMSSRPQPRCDTVVYEPVDYGVRDADLEKLESVDVLIHAGAFIPKSGAEVNAIAACTSNVDFTVALLGLPMSRLSRIVYVSTVDIYPADDILIEGRPALPTSLYGLSKFYCESLVSIFATQQSLSAQILRLGHVYGPGEEKFQKFLPTAIANIVAGRPVELWGDGSELRSFIYVDDVIAAILAAVELTDDAGTINVVGGRAVSIREVLDLLITASGKRVDVVEREYTGPKRDYVFDNTKLKQYLLPRETELAVGLKTEYDHVAGLR